MPRRLAATALTAALAATFLIAISDSPAAPATPSYVANPDFATNAGGWTAGIDDKVTRYVYPNGITAGQLGNANTKAKSQFLSMTSAPSVDTVPVAASTVTLTALMKTSVSPRSMALRLQEVNGNEVVQETSISTKTTSINWYTVTRTFTTKNAGSRLRVYVAVSGMSGTQYLRIRKVAVKITPPGAASAAACEAIDYSSPDQGTQTFAEEFDGDSLDPQLWRVRDDTFLNQDAAYIDRDNVSVHDGYLDITGRREPEENWRSNLKSLYGEENRVRKYSTGYVDSIKKKTYESPDAASEDRFSQKYGYFEARMWVPSAATMSRGIWPAFWLRADSKNGEIDVMESYGAPSIRNYDPSPSYEWNSWHDTAQVMSKDHFLGRPAVTEPIWKGWHTYGVNWSPTCLRYTLDGRTVGIARPMVGEVAYLNGDTFQSPFHLRFNMQVGSKYWGWPDQANTRDEFSFKIDWVRVHQAKTPGG